MKVDLSSIAMERGKQYETIITTRNQDGIQNAAPIGVICSGEDLILCRIFKGAKTLDNILSQREFVVNITHDPELFTLSVMGNLPEEYFNSDDSLKDAEAYFKCKVISTKEAVKQSDPVKKKDEAVVIKSKVCELVINRPTKAFNRSLGYVIESLANLTRIDLADENQKETYFKNFKEAYRVVNKVGYKKDKKAMNEIKKELIKRGFKS